MMKIATASFLVLALAVVTRAEPHVSFYSGEECSDDTLIVQINSQQCVNGDGLFGDFEVKSWMGMVAPGYPMVFTYPVENCVGAPDQSIMVYSDKCHVNTKHPEFTFNDVFVASVDSVEEE